MRSESKPGEKDKKLKLKRTTLRELTAEEATKVQGGATGTKTAYCGKAN